MLLAAKGPGRPGDVCDGIWRPGNPGDTSFVVELKSELLVGARGAVAEMFQGDGLPSYYEQVHNSSSSFIPEDPICFV